MAENEKVENESIVEDEQITKSEEAKTEQEKTSTGLDQNLAALLTYFAWFITGIIFLVIEKENRFVRFHAIQSIITGVVLTIFFTILNIIPLLGLLVSLLITPLTLILWVYLMYQAYQGKWTKLPIAGQMAEDQLNKMEQK